MAVSVSEKMESHSPNVTGNRGKSDLNNTENNSGENNDQSGVTQTDAEGKGRVTENGNKEQPK